jgi:spore coat protein U-like protein
LKHILGAAMKIVIPILAMSTLVASSVSCWSASAPPSNLKVTMEVDTGCSVNVGELHFGTHDRVNADIKIEGSIQVRCNLGTQYAIALNFGSNKIDTSIRRMKNAGNDSFIIYELYQDSKHEEIFGSYVETPVTGTKFDPTRLQSVYVKQLSGIGKAVKKAADGRVQSIPIYGRVLKSDAASAPPGDHSDTVTVTVNY